MKCHGAIVCSVNHESERRGGATQRLFDSFHQNGRAETLALIPQVDPKTPYADGGYRSKAWKTFCFRFGQVAKWDAGGRQCIKTGHNPRGFIDSYKAICYPALDILGGLCFEIPVQGILAATKLAAVVVFVERLNPKGITLHAGPNSLREVRTAFFKAAVGGGGLTTDSQNRC